MQDESGYFRIIEDGNPFNKAFYCPGCECSHGLNDNWTLTFQNGKPTVSPSLLVKHGKYTDKNDPLKYEAIQCHLFIRNGMIEYLSDCTHKLAGKTVEMRKGEDAEEPC